MIVDHFVVMAIVFSMLPISEVRGGIPLALSANLSWWQAWLLCVFFNILVIPLIFVFIMTLHKLLLHWHFYRKLFHFFLERAQKKLKKPITRYGYGGLFLFVAIPFPLTGVYTGALAAWFLGLKPLRAFWFMAAGVAVSGAIVLSVVTGGISLYSLFGQ